MKKPFFSVIIPTFNRAVKLRACLKSVLSQTFTDFEIVIIDDGSTDNTKNIILTEYEDARIRYFWQKGSGSPAHPRNQGIRKARGAWVAFLDSDDVWYPEKLDNVYNQIQDQSEQMSFATTKGCLIKRINTLTISHMSEKQMICTKVCCWMATAFPLQPLQSENLF